MRVVRTMGLDVSSKATGLVVLEEQFASPNVLDECELSFPDTKDMHRARMIAHGVGVSLLHWKPTLVIIEGYGFANSVSLVPLVEAGTMVRQVLFEFGVAYGILTPNGLKKFITGSGSAPKEKIVLEVYKRWNHEALSHNTADAYGLAAAGLAYKGKLKMTKPQEEALSKMVFPG